MVVCRFPHLPAMKCSCVSLCVVLSFGLCIGQSPCSAPNNTSGNCRSILECPSLRSIMNKPGLTPEEADFLKRSVCGFQGKIPKVCCPAVTKDQPSVPETCSTPEGFQGECRSIFECEHIVKRLQSPTVSADDKAYVNSIKCQVPNGFYTVCCGPSPAPAGVCVPSTALPDPRSECCGMDESERGVRLAGVGGNATFIDQYPWLAIVERRNRENETKLVCGGVLVSGRYVLTAAHCVTGAAGTPSSVRLGEYDISHSGSDCTDFFGGGEDCSEEPVVIAVERVISHPQYDPTSNLKRHDIALLRLLELAPYTDFIRPICLPTIDLAANPPRDLLVMAGWGANETHAVSNVKLQVYLPYKTMEECQAAYDHPRRRTQLGSGQLCAGGKEGQDSCKGDSGGPLMYGGGPRGVYEVVGIVSFGAAPCGRENVPGVYTNVFQYLPWIKDNIQE